MSYSILDGYPEHFDEYFDVEEFHGDGSWVPIEPYDWIRYRYHAHWQAALCDLGYGRYDAEEDEVVTYDDDFMRRINDYYSTIKYLEDNHQFAIKIVEVLMRHIPISYLHEDE